MSRGGFAALALLAVVLSACGGGSSSQPAATVNGHEIATSDYNLEVTQLRVQSASTHGYDPCSVAALTVECNALKQQALNQLIGTEIIREYAAAHHITVAQADFDRTWAVIFRTRFDNRADVLQAYTRRFHSTVAFIKQGVWDDMLHARVLAAVTQNMPAHASAVRLAIIRANSVGEMKTIRTLLKTHPFMTELRILPLTPTNTCAKVSNSCRDLGWVPLALIPPQRSQLAHTPAGKVVGPVADQVGFSFYYVEAADPKYTPTAQQLFTLRNRVFGVWLYDQVRKANVKKYVAV